MSDELNTLKDEVGESVSKFSSAPAIRSAFNAASTGLKIAGGALALGLLWKPALLVAAGVAIYSGVRGYGAYQEHNSSGPSAAP